MQPRRRDRVKQRWSRRLLDILGIHVVVHGPFPPPGQPCMLISNHVSWLDIHVIDAVNPARFVAKQEIRNWPIAGWLSARAGTLFINRERRRDTGRAAGVVTHVLKGGEVVGVFPEGTTSDGRGVLKFHASLLQPAIEAGTPFLPVALTYRDASGQLSDAPVYIGSTTLVESITRIAGQNYTRVEVTALPLHAYPPESHRRECARELRERILAALARTPD
jgi:1-acyl-sn-glycerol-3-phosphate acyltransferase